MKILLSPAKSLDFTKKAETFEFTVPVFLKEAESLAKKMKQNSVKKLSKMMSLSTELAELNHLRYQKWKSPSKPLDSNKPCIFAFSGEVYRGFDAASLNFEQIKIAQEKIRILSGLYGILKPLDLIYPYRLEMGTKWEITPKVNNLYAFWGSKIIDHLNKEIDESSELINLASHEYFKSVVTKKSKYKIITPIFKELKNGEYKIVMMYAKHARGAMARYIVTNNLTSSEELKLYNVDGYQFDVNLSTETEFVFTR